MTPKWQSSSFGLANHMQIQIQLIQFRYGNKTQEDTWYVRCLTWENKVLLSPTSVLEYVSYSEAIKQARKLADECLCDYTVAVSVGNCDSNGSWTSSTPILINDVNEDDEFVVALLQI
jgi:hypothetical protein